ncbi:MAG: aminotransferase class I/II-fold pyridoxal phosphate-dependent enzyme [Acidobacteriota bacterium]
MIQPAERTRKVEYAIRDILIIAEQAKAAGKQLLYLNIGDPMAFDYTTPRHMIEACYRALLDNHTGYANSSGLLEGREAIGNAVRRKGIKSWLDLFVTSGASEAIELCLTALVNPGEEVLTPSPGYPLYSAVLGKIQAQNVPYYLDEENNWEPDIADIKNKITPKTRALVLINPNNPTGSQYSREVLEEIVKLSIEHNIVVFSDEIYDKLVLDGEDSTSIASLSDEAPIITLNGLSKSYLVPGFRIGWAVVTGKKEMLSDYLDAVNKCLRARLCAVTPLQYAIKPALEGPQEHIAEVKAKLRRRRDITYSRLNAIPGISCVKPTAAFYAFPRLHIDQPDGQFVADLIRETGVVVVHGDGFGQRPGTRHMRIVFLPQEQILEEAFDRLEKFMAQRACKCAKA